MLAEIKSSKSCEISGGVLNNEEYDPEIRAGAAWALGEQNNETSLSSLIKHESTTRNKKHRAESAKF